MADQRSSAPPAAQDEVVIIDPRAILALAHPARMRIIDKLYGGAEMTASELAGLVGKTASAVSYHLRALERWGIVVRSQPRPDGRERPWLAAGHGLRLEVQSDRTQALAQGLVLDTYVTYLADEVQAWSHSEHTLAEEWQDIGMFSRGLPWLTAEEAGDLGEDLAAVVKEYGKGRRDAGKRPKGSRQVRVFVAVFPVADDDYAEP
jgi:DNA-binding transcriptional ArsR family regulator